MHTIEETIVRLSRDAMTSGTQIVREAARATGGLPVRADMGGVLVLMPTVDVFQYDLEAKTSSRVDDPGWRRVALVKAARSHPELVSLFPERPGTATTCSHCHGSGRLFDAVDCGRCMGTGWEEPSGDASGC